MKTCFVFSFVKDILIIGRGMQRQNFLVIFFPYKNVLSTRNDVQLQLRDYFFRNTLPDKLVIIGFEFNKVEIQELFQQHSEIYNYIPRFEYDENGGNICIHSIDGRGNLETIVGEHHSENFIKEVYRRGMVRIFRERGGLIVSQSAHHFVFPSGKHCDRFLRTGNVLLNGAEILFISSAIILYLKGKSYENIYCDTSSINSLGYSFISLLRDLGSLDQILHIESFGSYELFEKSTFRAKRNSLFLISSSTSGSILKRMTSKDNKGQNIALEDIAIIYGLSVESEYSNQVICDLTFTKEENPEGLQPFKSSNVKRGHQCELCEKGSKAIKVEGDVFLLEKPTVLGHRIITSDLPAFLRSFGDYYKPEQSDKSIIRTFYKENGRNDKKYELYVDVEKLFDLWEKRNDRARKYRSVFERLEKFISQNIPATIKYMIVLPDKASYKLAVIISEVIRANGLPFDNNNILSIENVKNISQEDRGVIAVISSSIVSGRNLLYLSRALRDYEKSYQRMYFTFLLRTENKGHSEFLDSNLSMGEFGRASHRIINVESIFCTQEAKNTPWHIELNFLKTLGEYCEEHEELQTTSDYCHKRIIVLNNSGREKGLEDNLFFPSLQGNTLKINNGFAFAPPKKDFIKNSTQSEIYFIVSNIINDIRGRGKLDQSEYVRNLIEPGNFVRFNDGIIQASILRAATGDELKYHISEEMSEQMKAVLGDMIIHLNDNHAEAINEFFYAIAIKKLRLPDPIIRDCIALLEEQEMYKSNSTILHGFVSYIKDKILVALDVNSSFDSTTSVIQEMKA